MQHPAKGDEHQHDFNLKQQSPLPTFVDCTATMPHQLTVLVRFAADESEETGWKFVHADVFRFPEHPNLFAAVIGTGTQMTFMTFAILALALVRSRRKIGACQHAYVDRGCC